MRVELKRLCCKMHLLLKVILLQKYSLKVSPRSCCLNRFEHSVKLENTHKFFPGMIKMVQQRLAC